MASLMICSAAESEYADALTWYVERSIEAAERFDTGLSQALDTIAAHPERFPRCDERHRFYLMRHFPYQIIYRERQDEVVVIAIAHTSRKPNYWSAR